MNALLPTEFPTIPSLQGGYLNLLEAVLRYCFEAVLRYRGCFEVTRGDLNPPIQSCSEVFGVFGV
jgi:hypothetical protein